MDFQGLKQDLVQASVGIILSSLYWPYIWGAATSPRWAFLAVILPILMLCYYKKIDFSIIHFVGLLFLGWCFLTLIWSANAYDGFDFAIKLVIIAEAFVLGSYLNSLRGLFIGLGLGLAVQSIIGTKTGLFINPNIFSETALIVCVGLLVYRVWIIAAALVPTIVMNGSRAAILIGACLIGLRLWRISRLLTVGLVLVGLSIAIYFTDYLKTQSISERLIIFADTLRNINLFGHGLGSFFSSYPFLTDSMDTLAYRPRFAHNDLLQIVFETGLVGGALIVAFFFMLLRFKVAERYVLLAFLGVGAFSFPAYLPVTAFIAAIVCGHIAGLRSKFRLSIAESRISLLEWNERKDRRFERA